MSDPDQATPARDGAGRWQSPQPNIVGLGIIASYGARFWGIVVVLGAVTGAGAAAFVELLRLTERLTYGHSGSSLQQIVRESPSWRHIVALLLAAAIVVVGLRLLGRLPTGGSEVTEAIWLRAGVLSWSASVARGLLSIITVGMGVSLGREAAPQLFGAATASRLATWAGLPVWQRRLLVASGVGAGFAAVYNVPLGGTLLAVEVMLGTLALPLVLPALLMSVTATAVAWIVLGTGPTYHVGVYPFHPSQLVYALVMGPILGLAGPAWTRMITLANQARPRGVGRWLAPFAACGALGLLSVPYPQLLGNGRGIVQLAIVGNLSVGLLLMLFLLKPLVTWACAASGAPGGLFTPTFAIGVLLAGAVGALWTHVWPGSPAGSYALIGGGAFLAAAMQAPLAGTVLVLELTRNFDSLMLPTLLAVVEATVISRRLGAASIYSARIGMTAAEPTGNAAAVAAIAALDAPAPADGPVSEPPGPRS